MTKVNFNRPSTHGSPILHDLLSSLLRNTQLFLAKMEFNSHARHVSKLHTTKDRGLTYSDASLAAHDTSFNTVLYTPCCFCFSRTNIDRKQHDEINTTQGPNYSNFSQPGFYSETYLLTAVFSCLKSVLQYCIKHGCQIRCLFKGQVINSYS